MTHDDHAARPGLGRIGRRELLRGAAIGAAGLTAAALIGCGGDDDDARGCDARGCDARGGDARGCNGGGGDARGCNGGGGDARGCNGGGGDACGGDSRCCNGGGSHADRGRRLEQRPAVLAGADRAP